MTGLEKRVGRRAFPRTYFPRDSDARKRSVLQFRVRLLQRPAPLATVHVAGLDKPSLRCCDLASGEEGASSVGHGRRVLNNCVLVTWGGRGGIHVSAGGTGDPRPVDSLLSAGGSWWYMEFFLFCDLVRGGEMGLNNGVLVT